MNENDVFIVFEILFFNQVQKAAESLSRVDRIKEQFLILRQQVDGLVAALGRNGVPIPCIIK